MPKTVTINIAPPKLTGVVLHHGDVLLLKWRDTGEHYYYQIVTYRVSDEDEYEYMYLQDLATMTIMEQCGVTCKEAFSKRKGRLLSSIMEHFEARRLDVVEVIQSDKIKVTIDHI